MGYFDFKAHMAVKTMEQTIQIANTTQTIKLLSKNDLIHHIKNYKFIHIGLIQIALKPLTLLGQNTCIMAQVRDGRCRDFKQSIELEDFDWSINIVTALSDTHTVSMI